ncbi:hypothetical protein D3C85_484390 [compost metagenome]
MAGRQTPAGPQLPRRRPPLARTDHGGGGVRGRIPDQGHGAASARSVDRQQPDADVVQLGGGHLLHRRGAAGARVRRSRDPALPDGGGRALQLQPARRPLWAHHAERRRPDHRRPLSGALFSTGPGRGADAPAPAAGLYGAAPEPHGRDRGLDLVVGRRPLHGAAGAGAHVGGDRRSQIHPGHGQGVPPHHRPPVGARAAPLPARPALQGPHRSQRPAHLLEPRQRLGHGRSGPHAGGHARRLRGAPGLRRYLPGHGRAHPRTATGRRPVARQPSGARALSAGRNLGLGLLRLRHGLGRQPRPAGPRDL